jgi:hypothetical protein
MKKIQITMVVDVSLPESEYKNMTHEEIAALFVEDGIKSITEVSIFNEEDIVFTKKYKRND